MNLQNLVSSIDNLLTPHNFHDYAPNGLQVEGRNEINRIITGVTATQELINAAIEREADAILVHHGWFWKNDDSRITGLRKRRIESLIKHDISLIAYHLPLDAHPEIGNNALLGKTLDFSIDGHFGEMDLGFIGSPINEENVLSLSQKLSAVLDRSPLILGRGETENHDIKRIAWCTGGAQDMIEEAAEQGVDAYISGEVSERTTHVARELGITYFAGGHHATERFGIWALGEWIQNEFSIETEFVDINNPV